MVDQSGTVIDIKTTSKRPNGISPSHRLQVTTYALLHQPCNESHTVRLDVLTKTATPAYVMLKTGLAEPDYANAAAIHPLVSQGWTKASTCPTAAPTSAAAGIARTGRPAKRSTADTCEADSR